MIGVIAEYKEIHEITVYKTNVSGKWHVLAAVESKILTMDFSF